MKITRITIKNFRQHRDVQIELDSSNSSFTIIKGRNGAGKTNLLRAITWALTGKLARDAIRFDPATLVSFSTSDETSIGEAIEVSVKLDIDLGGNNLAQIERSARFVKSGTSTKELSFSSSDLSILTLENKSKGWEKESKPDLWLEKVFPERFSHYFLFDGEHLHRFFKDTEAEFVKRAVLEIANIDQLEKIVEHLSIVNQALVKEAGSIAGEKGEDLRVKYEALESKISSLQAELDAKKKSLIDLDEKVNEAEIKLGDIAAIQKDIAYRDQLESLAESASKRGSQARSELYSWAFKTGPALMLQKELRNLRAEIEKAREAKVLPPPYKPEALTALIKQESCICGRELIPDSDACKHVEELIAKFAERSEIGIILSDSQGPLQGLQAGIDNSFDLLSSTQERIIASEIDEKKSMSELAVLNQKLAGSDDAQIAFIANAHSKAKAERDRTLIDRGSLETQLADSVEQQEKVKKLIENEAASQQKSIVALRRQQFAEEALGAAKGMYLDFSNQVREKVAKSLDEEFQSMIWKKDYFNPVEIDEDYRVLVYRKTGVEMRSELSAGETACLAFAFSLTLSDVAGFSYPMVVDSPLGRLDAEVKEFVSGVLAQALKSETEEQDKQILMLMTDSEYNKDVADALAHMQPKVIEIVFDQNTAETKVVE